MIKSAPNRLAFLLIDKYLHRLMKKSFSSFRLMNEIEPSENPIVFTPNHISWWDGFFIYLAVKKHYKKNVYIMMLEEQLKKYKFFRLTGCFGIKPSNPRSIIEASDYVAGLLKDSNNAVVIYMQGMIEPQDKEEIKIKSGLSFFLRNAPENTVLINAAFRIQFADKKTPDVYYKFSGKTLKNEYYSDKEKYYSLFRENINSLKLSAFALTEEKNNY